MRKEKHGVLGPDDDWPRGQPRGALRAAPRVAGVDARYIGSVDVLGNELLRDRAIGYFARRGKLVLGLN